MWRKLKENWGEVALAIGVYSTIGIAVLCSLAVACGLLALSFAAIRWSWSTIF